MLKKGMSRGRDTGRVPTGGLGRAPPCFCRDWSNRPRAEAYEGHLGKRLRLAQRFPFRLGHELQHNVLVRPERETDSVAIAFRVRELGPRRQSDEETLPEDRMRQEVPLSPPGAIGCRRLVPVDRVVNYIESP